MHNRRKDVQRPSDETVRDWLIAGVVILTLVLGVAYVSKDRIDTSSLSEISPAAGTTETITYDSPNYGSTQIDPADERPASNSGSLDSDHPSE